MRGFSIIGEPAFCFVGPLLNSKTGAEAPAI